MSDKNIEIILFVKVLKDFSFNGIDSVLTPECRIEATFGDNYLQGFD